jgi:hypothetical protein
MLPFLLLSKNFTDLHNRQAKFKKVQINDKLSFIKHFFDVIQWLDG